MRSRTRRPTRAFLLSAPVLLFLTLAPAGPAAAQPRPPAPPPPAKYKAEVRYRINAPRDQHVAQFDALVDHLEKLGFEFVPPLEELPPTVRADPSRDVLTGLVPSENALKVLNHPTVAAVLLLPPDYKLPDQAEQPVRVQLELLSGYSPDQQLRLINQVRVLLQHFGFREAYGYDHRGYTGRPNSRLRGALPVGNLHVLFRDLRQQPAGWLGPRVGDLPGPLRGAPPILLTEVLADTSPLAEPTEPPERGEEAFEKIGDGLWALARDKEQQARPVRMEIILSSLPAPGDEGWKRALAQAVPDLFIEGNLGQFVTAVAAAGQAKVLAGLPLVSAVRLPRAPVVAVDPRVAPRGDDARALRESGLSALHKRGFQGKGVRLAVLDSDFRGFEDFLKAGALPAGTRLVDLTAHRNPALAPDPYPDDGALVGHGTHCALAAALAAPEAELTLVRIDPSTPYMLAEVAELIRGTGAVSASLARRSADLGAEAATLRLRRARILKERKTVLENFEDEREAEQRFGFLGSVRAWVFSPREWHYKRLAELERDEAAYRERQRQFDLVLLAPRGLRGIRVVTCSLVWNEGHPLGDRSPLTRYFETTLPAACSTPAPPHPRTAPARGPRQPNPPLWLNTAGNTRGQAWDGWLRDSDGDGVLEFLAPEAPLPAGLWTRDLAFLAWQPYAGPRSPDLPAKTRVRVTVQWTEPHDPDYFLRPGEPDRYLQPLARLRLTVLRQRDPQAKALPADDFDAVARTDARPLRLDNAPDSSTYELALEFEAEQGGRYALQVERHRGTQWIMVPDARTNRYTLRLVTDLVSTGIRPLGAATLPALEKQWQLTPRLFVEAVGGPAARQGRPVFRDFATDVGTVGVPADARRVVAVGAADPKGNAEPYSAPGPPHGLELFVTPRLSAFDTLDLGTRGPAFGAGLATPMAAGAAASMLSAGWSPDAVLRQFLGTGRHVLAVPAGR
jgi:hypothetical protein